MRLLLVEDDLYVARFLNRALAEARYAVEHVAEGEAALKRALRSPFDAIVLDVMLPGIDGFEVVRRLRAAGCRTPVLYLTCRDDVEDIVRGLDAGGDDYLTKPFSIAELLARLRARLRPPAGPGPVHELFAGDVAMDLLGRKVSRGGEALALTAKEFDLLEYFLRNPGQVLTRAMILERVWGIRVDYESNLIEVHLARLRKKLEAGGRTRLIETVKGVGYVLRPPPG